MKIGIIGTGHIGKTLSLRLSKVGHDVTVANSRGPHSIDPEVLAGGATATTAEEAVKNVDVLILSVPFHRIPQVAHLVKDVPERTVVIDTSNYYPHRDGEVEPVRDGEVESIWVSKQLGRRIVKAWNAIGSDSLANRHQPSQDSDRIAIPVAGDDEHGRRVAMSLVEATGFDPFDAGTLADSWRFQPGAPAYCTDLTRSQMVTALASAEAGRLPKRRDLAVAAITERLGDGTSNPDTDYLVRLNRALYL